MNIKNLSHSFVIQSIALFPQDQAPQVPQLNDPVKSPAKKNQATVFQQQPGIALSPVVIQDITIPEINEVTLDQMAKDLGIKRKGIDVVDGKISNLVIRTKRLRIPLNRQAFEGKPLSPVRSDWIAIEAEPGTEIVIKGLEIKDSTIVGFKGIYVLNEKSLYIRPLFINPENETATTKDSTVVYMQPRIGIQTLEFARPNEKGEIWPVSMNGITIDGILAPFYWIPKALWGSYPGEANGQLPERDDMSFFGTKHSIIEGPVSGLFHGKGEDPNDYALKYWSEMRKDLKENLAKFEGITNSKGILPRGYFALTNLSFYDLINPTLAPDSHNNNGKHGTQDLAWTFQLPQDIAARYTPFELSNNDIVRQIPELLEETTEAISTEDANFGKININQNFDDLGIRIVGQLSTKSNTDIKTYGPQDLIRSLGKDLTAVFLSSGREIPAETQIMHIHHQNWEDPRDFKSRYKEFLNQNPGGLAQALQPKDESYTAFRIRVGNDRRLPKEYHWQPNLTPEELLKGARIRISQIHPDLRPQDRRLIISGDLQALHQKINMYFQNNPDNPLGVPPELFSEELIDLSQWMRQIRLHKSTIPKDLQPVDKRVVANQDSQEYRDEILLYFEQNPNNPLSFPENLKPIGEIKDPKIAKAVSDDLLDQVMKIIRTDINLIDPKLRPRTKTVNMLQDPQEYRQLAQSHPDFPEKLRPPQGITIEDWKELLEANLQRIPKNLKPEVVWQAQLQDPIAYHEKIFTYLEENPENSLNFPEELLPRFENDEAYAKFINSRRGLIRRQLVDEGRSHDYQDLMIKEQDPEEFFINALTYLETHPNAVDKDLLPRKKQSSSQANMSYYGLAMTSDPDVPNSPNINFSAKAQANAYGISKPIITLSSELFFHTDSSKEHVPFSGAMRNIALSSGPITVTNPKTKIKGRISGLEMRLDSLRWGDQGAYLFADYIAKGEVVPQYLKDAALLANSPNQQGDLHPIQSIGENYVTTIPRFDFEMELGDGQSIEGSLFNISSRYDFSNLKIGSVDPGEKGEIIAQQLIASALEDITSGRLFEQGLTLKGFEGNLGGSFIRYKDDKSEITLTTTAANSSIEIENGVAHFKNNVPGPLPANEIAIDAEIDGEKVYRVGIAVRDYSGKLSAKDGDYYFSEGYLSSDGKVYSNEAAGNLDLRFSSLVKDVQAAVRYEPDLSQVKIHKDFRAQLVSTIKGDNIDSEIDVTISNSSPKSQITYNTKTGDIEGNDVSISTTASLTTFDNDGKKITQQFRCPVDVQLKDFAVTSSGISVSSRFTSSELYYHMTQENDQNAPSIFSVKVFGISGSMDIKEDGNQIALEAESNGIGASFEQGDFSANLQFSRATFESINREVKSLLEGLRERDPDKFKNWSAPFKITLEGGQEYTALIQSVNNDSELYAQLAHPISLSGELGGDRLFMLNRPQAIRATVHGHLKDYQVQNGEILIEPTTWSHNIYDVEEVIKTRKGKISFDLDMAANITSSIIVTKDNKTFNPIQLTTEIFSDVRNGNIEIVEDIVESLKTRGEIDANFRAVGILLGARNTHAKVIAPGDPNGPVQWVEMQLGQAFVSIDEIKSAANGVEINGSQLGAKDFKLYYVRGIPDATDPNGQVDASKPHDIIEITLDDVRGPANYSDANNGTITGSSALTNFEFIAAHLSDPWGEQSTRAQFDRISGTFNLQGIKDVLDSDGFDLENLSGSGFEFEAFVNDKEKHNFFAKSTYPETVKVTAHVSGQKVKGNVAGKFLVVDYYGSEIPYFLQYGKKFVKGVLPGINLVDSLIIQAPNKEFPKGFVSAKCDAAQILAPLGFSPTRPSSATWDISSSDRQNYGIENLDAMTRVIFGRERIAQINQGRAVDPENFTVNELNNIPCFSNLSDFQSNSSGPSQKELIRNALSLTDFSVYASMEDQISALGKLFDNERVIKAALQYANIPVYDALKDPKWNQIAQDVLGQEYKDLGQPAFAQLPGSTQKRVFDAYLRNEIQGKNQIQTYEAMTEIIYPNQNKHFDELNEKQRMEVKDSVIAFGYQYSDKNREERIAAIQRMFESSAFYEQMNSTQQREFIVNTLVRAESKATDRSINQTNHIDYNGDPLPLINALPLKIQRARVFLFMNLENATGDAPLKGSMVDVMGDFYQSEFTAIPLGDSTSAMLEDSAYHVNTRIGINEQGQLAPESLTYLRYGLLQPRSQLAKKNTNFTSISDGLVINWSGFASKFKNEPTHYPWFEEHAGSRVLEGIPKPTEVLAKTSLGEENTLVMNGKLEDGFVNITDLFSSYTKFESNSSLKSWPIFNRFPQLMGESSDVLQAHVFDLYALFGVADPYAKPDANMNGTLALHNKKGKEVARYEVLAGKIYRDDGTWDGKSGMDPYYQCRFIYDGKPYHRRLDPSGEVDPRGFQFIAKSSASGTTP